MRDLILSELKESQEVLSAFLADPGSIDSIHAAAVLMAEGIKSGGKIISCGNGGSHCDAMHFAEEMTGRFRDDRKPFPAMAISDPTHLSCVSNDYGYARVFSRFIEGLGKPEDVLLGISTSGNSENVINAAEAAKAIGMKVVILSGHDGGQLAGMADVEIRVSHFGYSDRIQEMHIKIIHILIQLIEKMVY